MVAVQLSVEPSYRSIFTEGAAKSGMMNIDLSSFLGFNPPFRPKMPSSVVQ